jgi:hypothetical protein
LIWQFLRNKACRQIVASAGVIALTKQLQTLQAAANAKTRCSQIMVVKEGCKVVDLKTADY